MGQLAGITLDPTRDEPLYRQLFDEIVVRIRSGAYPSGYRLVPTRSLSSQLGTHRNTVVRAYEDLETAGFVHSTVGRGTFVAATARPRARPKDPVPDDRTCRGRRCLSRAVDAEPLGRFDRVAPVAVGRDVINLTRMQPYGDLIPHELLQRCLDHVLRTEGSKALVYAPRDGLPKLRAVIAEDLVRQGVPASGDDILITTGSQQALDLLARSFINPGDTYLVEETTYSGAINILAAAGARLIGVPSDGEGPDPDALARLSRSGAKGFYLMPNCNNPTGACISQARRELLVRWSHTAGVPIIEDDYSSDLQLGEGAMPSPMRALDGNVIYMGTFSKKLAPALRIGFLLCPAPLRSRILALKHTLDLGTSALLQHALAEFLERGYLRAHLRKILPEYRKRRDALESSLRQHLSGRYPWRQPETGLVLWLPLPARYPLEALCQQAQRQGVLVSPGTLNEIAPRDKPGIRLTFCAESAARVAEGGRRLARAFDDIDQRTRSKQSHTASATFGIV